MGHCDLLVVQVSRLHLKSRMPLLTIDVPALCSLSLSHRCSKRSNLKELSVTTLLGVWVRIRPVFFAIHELSASPGSWMGGGPVYTARNQSSHFRRIRLRVLRPNYPTREIPAQEYHMAHPTLRVVPKKPQTIAASVRD